MSYWQRKELERLARLTGMESHPFIKRMLNSTGAPIKPELTEKIIKLLQTRAAVMVPDQHPFLPAPKEVSSGGASVSPGLVIGGNGPEVSFQDSLKSFLQHKGFFGPAGSGKTTLMLIMTRQVHERGIPVWWFDSEDEMAPLLADLDDILFIDESDLRFNPFEAPPGCDPSQYLDKVVSRFRETLYFRDGSVNLTRSVCKTLLEQQGGFSLGDIYRSLLRMKFKVNQRTAGYWETCCNRFSDLLSSLGKVIDVRQGHDIGRLLERSVVWRLRTLSDDHLAFLTSCLLLWVENYRPVHYDWELKNIFTFDEVTRVCNLGRERRADTSEPFFYDFARTCRKRGIGLAVATQTPGLLSVPVLANLSTWYAFRPVDSYSTRVIASSMGLSDEQMEYLKGLEKEMGRVVSVRHPDHPFPFLVQVAEWPVTPASPEVILRAVESTRVWLGPVPVQAAEETKEPQVERPAAAQEDKGSSPLHPFELSKRDLDYVQLIGETPFLPVTERDRREGISAWMGNAIRRELEDAGLIRLHRVSLGGRGRRITLTELMSRAYQVLEALQVKVEKPKGNGGYVHRFWQHTIHQWAVKQGYPAQIEETLREKRVDVGVKWAEKRRAVEVVIEGLDKELSNLWKDLEDGWDQVVFCAEKQQTLEKLEKMIDEEYGEGLKAEGRVAFMRSKDFLS